MKRMVFWFCFSLLWILSSAYGVHGQGEPFFKGKTVRIVVGFSTGGTRDPWARAIAQHMGKYTSGNPNFIVQNMPGGGSIIAANYVYNLPKPDGLTLGLIARLSISISSLEEKRSSLTGLNSPGSALRRGLTVYSTFVPTRRIRRWRISARLASLQDAAPRVSGPQPTTFLNSSKML